jgi:hypothetical protein
VGCIPEGAKPAARFTLTMTKLSYRLADVARNKTIKAGSEWSYGGRRRRTRGVLAVDTWIKDRWIPSWVARVLQGLPQLNCPVAVGAWISLFASVCVDRESRSIRTARTSQGSARSGHCRCLSGPRGAKARPSSLAYSALANNFWSFVGLR